MLELIAMLASGTAAAGGFASARRFVRERLRYVDVAQRKRAAIAAGAGAAILAAPVVWVVPIIGAGTAVLFGAGVGYGVYKGAKDVRGQRGEVMVV